LPFGAAGPAPQHDGDNLSSIARPSQCHHAVTLNVAKLTEQLFVAGTVVPGLASNCSTLELLNVRKRRPVVGARRFADRS
jgi:hypothetical protein